MALHDRHANLVRDHWRRRGREATAYQRHEGGRAGGTVLGAVDQATTLTVRDAVLALPDRLRLPVLLHYFADLHGGPGGRSTRVGPRVRSSGTCTTRGGRMAPMLGGSR